MKPSVKSPVISRAGRALATRRRMLATAQELFVQQGYAATTVEQIAADAGVAVQTVYYTFRTKGLLLRELVEVTAAGQELPAPVMERAWAREMLSALDPTQLPPPDTNTGLRTLQPMHPVPKGRGALIGVSATVCVASPTISILSPDRRVQLRPPTRARASSTVTSKPARSSS